MRHRTPHQSQAQRPAKRFSAPNVPGDAARRPPGEPPPPPPPATAAAAGLCTDTANGEPRSP